MRPISVLLTNNALAARGGSETYIRDVALDLLRRGHRPVAFSLILGDVANELRRATIPVIDDLSRLAEPPDVVHGHHHLETLIAALTFPDAPIVHFCHGWVPWEELPLRHPSIRRYVAVDDVCVDRLVREEGIDPCRVELLLNFVDLERFRSRRPLPSRPARALVLGNAARDEGYVRAIAAACHAAGVALDVVGASAGNASATPESLLPGYDLVFAKARTALEALAVGCATVVSDAAGAGPLVTPGNYDVLRPLNFGIRTLTQAHDRSWYAAQIAAYRADAAADVSARVRREAGLTPAVDRLLDIYHSAMNAPPGAGDPLRAAAAHCRRIALPLKQAHGMADQVHALAAGLARADAERERLTREAASERDRLRREASCERDRLTGLQRDTQREIEAFRALPTIRLRDAVLKAPVVGRVVQAGARGLSRMLGN
jgi:hypothetical protein